MGVQDLRTHPPKIPQTTLWIILVTVILIIATGGYYVLKDNGNSTASSSNNSNESAIIPTNVDANGNTESNTNQDQNPTSIYDAPEGPFTTNTSTTVAFAYSKSTDRLVSRVAKIDASTGESITTAQFNTIDIQENLKLAQTPSRPSLFRFGADGDSILFLLSGTSPSPFTGLYRSSFLTPEKIETIVQYDPVNLFNGDIPSITDFFFNAQTNQVVFVIRGDSTEERNHYVKTVNLQDKIVRDLGAYRTTPQLVGFPNQGEHVEILYADKVQYKGNKNQNVTWYYDIIRIADAQVLTSKKLVDEAKINQTTGEPDIMLTPDSIAPNNQVSGFRHTRMNNGNREYIFAFYNITTGPLPEIVVPRNPGNHFVWSPNSGKILYTRYEDSTTKGIILDLAKGEVDTINDVGEVLLWYPSEMIVYMTRTNTLASYNPTTKKQQEIFSEVLMPSNGYDYYGGASITSGIRWVNR